MHDLRLLNSFVHAAHSLSFTAAAHALTCTPGAVSRNIAKLEQDLGVRLFNRTTREISLTDEGAEFYEAVSAGLAALDSANDVIDRAHGEITGIVRIAIGSFYKKRALPVLARLHDIHPGLRLEVAFADNPGDLVARNLDMILCSGKLDDSRYICRWLGRMKLRLVATPEYIERQGAPAHPSDLRTRDCINVRDGAASCTWRFSPAPHLAATAVDVDPPCRLRVTEQVEAVEQAVLMGFAPTVLWSQVAQPHLDAGTLVELLPDWEVLPHGTMDGDVHLCYPHRDYMPARIRTVIDALIRDVHIVEDAAHLTQRSVQTC